jgi:hypothetical protein
VILSWSRNHENGPKSPEYPPFTPAGLKSGRHPRKYDMVSHHVISPAWVTAFWGSLWLGRMLFLATEVVNVQTGTI